MLRKHRYSLPFWECKWHKSLEQLSVSYFLTLANIRKFPCFSPKSWLEKVGMSSQEILIVLFHDMQFKLNDEHGDIKTCMILTGTFNSHSW